MREHWCLHCASQWGQWTPLSERVHCVAVAFKMTERVEQKICIKFCVKLGHSSLETSRMTQKATAMGNWWLAASSQQCLYIMSRTEFFCETSNHPGDSAPLQPRCGVLQLLAFPKTKITFERDEISDCQWDSGKYDGAADGKTVWGPKVPTLKGTEVSLSYVQCFFYLVSSSTDISIFHITWLDTFWTDSYNPNSFHLTCPISWWSMRKYH